MCSRLTTQYFTLLWEATLQSESGLGDSRLPQPHLSSTPCHPKCPPCSVPQSWRRREVSAQMGEGQMALNEVFHPRCRCTLRLIMPPPRQTVMELSSGQILPVILDLFWLPIRVPTLKLSTNLPPSFEARKFWQGIQNFDKDILNERMLKNELSTNQNAEKCSKLWCLLENSTASWIAWMNEKMLTNTA